LSIQQDELSIFDVSIPEKTREKLALFSKLVSAHFGFLNDLGYKGPVVKISKHEVLDFCNTILFQNDHACREVRVVFYCESLNINNGDFLILDIWRKSHKLKTKASDNILVFEKFIEKYRPDIDQKSLDIRSYKTPLMESMERVLSLCASLLKAEMEEVLKGEYWEEGLYNEWV
jgi:hypothetical protein